MTDNLKGLTACVVDQGMFVELALRLGREDGFGRVLYHCPIQPAYPRLNEACVGDGFKEIARIDEVWSVYDDVDVWVFPDCSHPELQQFLRDDGKAVWGSGKGVYLEWNRQAFRRKLESVGLPVKDFEVVRGVKALRRYLDGKEDQYIRISRWRGNGETWHWINADTCSGKLDQIEVEFGPMQEEMVFLVEPGYDAKEVGYDGFVVDGEFPEHSFHGLEVKDKAYFGAFVAKGDLPSALKEVNADIRSLLAGYRNFFSTEVRIAEDSLPYFTDPTCRLASPAGEVMLEGFKNLPEIIWQGAQGNLVDPVPAGLFACQALIEHNGEDKHWRSMVVPNDVRRWVKFYNACQIGDEAYTFPPLPHSSTTVGSVIGLGPSPKDAMDALREHVEAVKDNPVTIEVEALADAFLTLGDDDGKVMELGGETAPEPAEVFNE